MTIRLALLRTFLQCLNLLVDGSDDGNQIGNVRKKILCEKPEQELGSGLCGDGESNSLKDGSM